MSLPAIEIDAVTILLRGHFNPAIFSPAWLLSEGLIGSSEYRNSEVEVIAREVAIFKCSWLQIRVTLDSLELSSSDAGEAERVRDVAVGILSTLRHTPIGVMGINRLFHYSTGSEEQWHKVGDTLAPKGRWEDVLKLPGTRSIRMIGVRPDKYTGHVQVDVEPSAQILWGIFVGYNDHFTLSTVGSQPRSRDEFAEQDSTGTVEPTIGKSSTAVEILATEWEASMERALKVLSFVNRIGATE